MSKSAKVTVPEVEALAIRALSADTFEEFVDRLGQHGFKFIPCGHNSSLRQAKANRGHRFKTLGLLDELENSLHRWHRPNWPIDPALFDQHPGLLDDVEAIDELWMELMDYRHVLTTGQLHLISSLLLEYGRSEVASAVRAAARNVMLHPVRRGLAYVKATLENRKERREENGPREGEAYRVQEDIRCIDCGSDIDVGDIAVFRGGAYHCSKCANLDKLTFLKAGNAQLTRKAGALSRYKVVVFELTEYEPKRVGTLLEAEAIRKAKSLMPRTTDSPPQTNQCTPLK